MKKLLMLGVIVAITAGIAWGQTRLERSYGTLTSSSTSVGTWVRTGAASKIIFNFECTGGADTVFVRIFGKTIATDTGWHLDADNDTVKHYSTSGDSGFSIACDYVLPYMGVKVDSLPRGSVVVSYTEERY